MNSDRLQRWLERNRVGMEWLQLREDGDEAHFQRWHVDALRDDVAQLIFDSAGDYADAKGESVRVAIEVLDDEQAVIAKTVHKAASHEAQTFDQANAANVSEKTIISQLLRHIEVQQHVLSGSSLGTFQALERTLALQTKLLEKQQQQLSQLADQVLTMKLERAQAAVAEDEEARAQDSEEESRARARAMEKVAELLPPMTNMAMQYFQQRLINGAGGPVHAQASVGPAV